MLDIPIIPYQRGDEWNSLLVRVVSRSAEKYIANSETTRKSLLKLGLPASKIVTIYPAADVTAIKSRQRSQVSRRDFGVDVAAPCFGVVGMLLPWKGQDIFLRAAKIVVEQLPTARAFVVGGPPAGELDYLVSLKNLAATLKLDDKVIFTGFREDVLDIMELLQVIVHTSVQPEPFGRVVLEAMALKKPVIASNDGGPKEIILHGETGLLVPPGNPEALAEAILSVLSDPVLSTKFAETGFQLAKNKFSLDRHVEAVQSVYRSVLNGANEKTVFDSVDKIPDH
jgi:glycosyltransferase involved in cell wall biosynthesis